jgi:hypothetical protein
VTHINDPMELIIAAALTDAGIRFHHQTDKNSKAFAARLDFYLPDYEVYIEVKRMSTHRIASQMGRVANVIAVQGKPAVEVMAGLIRQSGGKIFGGD